MASSPIFCRVYLSSWLTLPPTGSKGGKEKGEMYDILWLGEDILWMLLCNNISNNPMIWHELQESLHWVAVMKSNEKAYFHYVIITNIQ